MSESRNWRPGRWAEETIRRHVKRVYRTAERELAIIVGPHLGNILTAEFLAGMESEQTKVELRKLGIKTRGGG